MNLKVLMAKGSPTLGLTCCSLGGGGYLPYLSLMVEGLSEPARLILTGRLAVKLVEHCPFFIFYCF